MRLDSMTTSMAVVATMAAMSTTMTSGIQINIKNSCAHPIIVWDNAVEVPVQPGGSTMKGMPPGQLGMFRAGKDPQATLAEFSNNGGKVWYDISVIPTAPGKGPGFCPSLDECKRVTGGRGFNLPMQMVPLNNVDGNRCRVLTCMHERCEDAYLFPKDDTKTHNCPGETNFEVIFCPGGPGGAPTPAPPTPAPSPIFPTLPPFPTFPPLPTLPPLPFFPPQLQSNETAADATTMTSSSSSSAADSNAGVDPNAIPAPSNTDPSASSTTTEGDSNNVQETPGAPVQEITTKSGNSGGSTVGIVLACVFVFIGAIAAFVIIVVRAKKRKLDEMEVKSPVNHNNYQYDRASFL